MNSLFEQEVSSEMMARINRLKADSRSQWGKMSVSQMVKHAQAPFKVALGEVKLNRGMIGFLFGGMAKKKISSPDPIGKNLPTDKYFVVSNQPDFETERKELIEWVKRFSQSGPSAITQNPHPFFGKMTTKEWDMLMYKHLDHHLRQFGV